MKLSKRAQVKEGVDLSEEDLALIHAQSRSPLTAEEIYPFAVRLCDNRVDRDGERFPRQTLEELAPLFVGKCGIFDHRWSAREQVARIYRTEVVDEEGTAEGGEGRCYLKGYAYMMRTESNKDLIAEIEGGIKREVSVGCSVARRVCSICGADLEDRSRCTHVKGEEYHGQRCWAELLQATDAYEWSFVAVPAQERAGVIKGLSPTLKDLVQSHPECRSELERLEEEAARGRRYLSSLREEVARLGGMAEPGLRQKTLRSIVERLGEEELTALKHLYEARVEEAYPEGSQLSYASSRTGREGGDEVFRI